MNAVTIEERESRTPAQDARAGDGQACLRLSGPLTAATAPRLRALVLEALARGHAGVVIDLEAVTGLDAAGIAALLDAHRTLHAQTSGTLVLRVNAIVCRALKDSGTIAAFALSQSSGM